MTHSAPGGRLTGRPRRPVTGPGTVPGFPSPIPGINTQPHRPKRLDSQPYPSRGSACPGIHNTAVAATGTMETGDSSRSAEVADPEGPRGADVTAGPTSTPRAQLGRISQRRHTVGLPLLRCLSLLVFGERRGALGFPCDSPHIYRGLGFERRGKGGS